ncbi:unnamed protein product [Scytosiphon promiscuus]
MALSVPMPPALSPLAIDDGDGLDGWDAAGEDFDFEDLFRDAEEAEAGMGVVADNNNDSSNDLSHHPAARVGEGGDGDASSVEMSDVEFERGLLSLAEATSTAAVGAAAEFNSAVSEDDLCSAGGTTAPNITASTTAWSTTSASEESDDGSRSSLCGSSSSSSSAFGGMPPVSAPVAVPTTAGRMSHNTSSGASIEAPRSSTSEAGIVNDDTTGGNKRVLAVSSGAGTPILPSFFAPAFGGGAGSSAAAAAALSALNFGGLQAAAGEAWKRMRGAEDVPAGAGLGRASAGSLEDGGGAAAPSRLLSGGGSGGHGRVNKRAKREERLMKNREAANRSRVKRKEVLSELENRADNLSKSLAESRDEAASLQQEIASLREQNSFLRGMLSAQGTGTADLPSVIPSSTSPGGAGQRFQQSHRSAPGGASAAVAGASAIVGAVGTGLAVISCVALSAAGFGGGGRAGFRGGAGGGAGYGYNGGGGVGSAHSSSSSGGGWGGGEAHSSRGGGGRRMLLSVGDFETDLFSQPGGGTTFLPFSNGGLGGYFVVGLTVALAFATVCIVARWAYHKEFARRRHIAVRRGRRGAVASRRGGKGKGGGFDPTGGVFWPLDRLFCGGKTVRKAM